MNKKRTGLKNETMCCGTINSKKRIRKDHLLITLYGEIDELSCLLCATKFLIKINKIKISIKQVQEDLVCCLNELSTGKKYLHQKHLAWLQKEILRYRSASAKTDDFLTKKKNLSAALSDLSRAICRRIERHLVTYMRHKKISDHLLSYFNQLSKLLFYLTRFLNEKA